MQTIPKMNLEDLKPKLANGKYILVFSAEWCSDCQFMKPFLPEIIKEYPEYNFLSVDRDENIDLAAELAVFGIPSFIAFSNGDEIGRFVNKDRKTKKQIEQFIDGLKK